MNIKLLKVVFVLFFALLYAFCGAQTNNFSEENETRSLSDIHKMIRSVQSIHNLSQINDNKKTYELNIATGGEDNSIQLRILKKNKCVLEIVDIEDTDIAEVKLINDKGNIVMDKKIKNGNAEICFNKCKTGNYFLEVFINNRIKKQFNIIKK